jgi:hypothetical protein
MGKRGVPLRWACATDYENVTALRCNSHEYIVLILLLSPRGFPRCVDRLHWHTGSLGPWDAAGQELDSALHSPGLMRLNKALWPSFAPPQPHHLSGIHIQDHRDVHPALGGRQTGDVSRPDLVGRLGRKASIYGVRGNGLCMGAVRGRFVATFVNRF